MVGEMDITVDRIQLLETLKANRETHGESFKQAMTGYVALQREELENLLKKLNDGEAIPSRLRELPPEDHTKDYDEAIAMMEWAIGPEVLLTQSQFRQYVMDNWGWKEQWTASNTGYITAASTRS